MPTEMKLWRIEGERPIAIPQDKLNLESRIEEWLREDIGLVNDDLLVIGQQVRTDYGGLIDLLAIDSIGNLVILELKRDRTPRDIVAQVLDYASWVQDLGHESIEEIANSFIEEKSFEEAFRERFQSDLPDVLNERHRMYVVASYLDPSTERIVKYLSEKYGVDINIATFAYFKSPDGELLGRSLLLDETAVQTRAESTSKRKPPRSLEEFREIAEDKGVGELYDKFLDLRPLFDGVNRTRISVCLFGRMGPEKAQTFTILAVYPESSSLENGLAVLCLADRAHEYFGLDPERIKVVCGQQVVIRTGVHPNDVYYFDAQQLETLASLLREATSAVTTHQ